MNTTYWYDGEQKPKGKGVYERLYPHAVLYSYWSGKKWSLSFDTPEAAFDCRRMTSVNQNKPWRGLTQQPITDWSAA